MTILLESGPVVLTFYPKAFTPGCTRQMNNYGRIEDEFNVLKAQVVAVSADDNETQARFKKSTAASFPFIADPEGRIIALYDIKTPVLTMAKRRTFVVGTDGLIKSIETGDDVIDAAGTVDIVGQTCSAP